MKKEPMNLKKGQLIKAKKVSDALAKPPGTSSAKEGVDLVSIAKTLTDRKMAKIKASTEDVEE